MTNSDSLARVLVTGGSGFIGTNLIESLLKKNTAILNIDIKPPPISIHAPYWEKCDILEAARLQHAFLEFNPTHVIHLAARTHTNSSDLADYRTNTEGTANVLQAIGLTKTVRRAIITSSQFVFGPGGLPEHDEDFKPVGAYGESKVITEKLTRAANLMCIWTIIRPTNIWGPWHPRYPYEFWRILSRGLYFHPGRIKVMRCYGYVRNVVYQIEQILEADLEKANRRVFYLGDKPIALLQWVNAFAHALTGKDARIVPRSVVKNMALTGDILKKLGVNFPISTSRYYSMTENYLAPMRITFDVLGESPVSLEDGVKETAIWLRERGFITRIYVQ